jgi:DNA-binding beta-propeller fold protein YncE
MTHTVAPSPTLQPTPTLSVAERFTPAPWWDYANAGLQGVTAEQYARPTGVAVAEDGTLFVAASGANIIYHIDPYGKVLAKWGSLGKSTETEKALPGTFNEPWGILLTPDGFVYVADLWNHRIQKFTLDGQFVLEWGEFGAGDVPDKFWGPRGLARDSAGHILITDTGNKRIVVYDSNGVFISQIGGEGAGLGQFNEPVGIAIDEQDTVYVADAWNRRVQVLKINTAGKLTPLISWNVKGWGSDSMDVKPYLCLYQGSLFITDPEHNLVLQYSTEGQLLNTYDLSSTGILAGGAVTGIASDPSGGLWVSDLKYYAWIHMKP